MHTPGPWEAKEDTYLGLRYDESGNYLSGWRVEQKYIIVAELLGGIAPLEAKANARLIAAAPELLEAAQKLIMHHHQDNLHPVDYHRLEAAIAKARGEL